MERLPGRSGGGRRRGCPRSPGPALVLVRRSFKHPAMVPEPVLEVCWRCQQIDRLHRHHLGPRGDTAGHRAWGMAPGDGTGAALVGSSALERTAPFAAQQAAHGLAAALVGRQQVRCRAMGATCRWRWWASMRMDPPKSHRTRPTRRRRLPRNEPVSP